MNGCEVFDLSSLLSISDKSGEKRRRGARIKIILPKAPQSADWELDPGQAFATRHILLNKTI